FEVDRGRPRGDELRIGTLEARVGGVGAQGERDAVGGRGTDQRGAAHLHGLDRARRIVRAGQRNRGKTVRQQGLVDRTDGRSVGLEPDAARVLAIDLHGPSHSLLRRADKARRRPARPAKIVPKLSRACRNSGLPKSRKLGTISLGGPVYGVRGGPMKGIDGTIASARPGGAPWAGSDETSSWPDEAGAQANNDATAPDASDLADLLQRHGEVLAAEQQSFNDRLSNLLNTRRELPANDRRRLNALLAELLDHSDELAARDNAVAGEHQDVDQGQPVDLDAAG